MRAVRETKPDASAVFDDAPSGVRRVAPAVRTAPTAERYVRPRWWISAAALTLVASACVGCVALAIGAYGVALDCVGPLTVSGVALLVAEELGLAS